MKINGKDESYYYCKHSDQWKYPEVNVYCEKIPLWEQKVICCSCSQEVWRNDCYYSLGHFACTNCGKQFRSLDKMWRSIGVPLFL